MTMDVGSYPNMDGYYLWKKLFMINSLKDSVIAWIKYKAENMFPGLSSRSR